MAKANIKVNKIIAGPKINKDNVDPVIGEMTCDAPSTRRMLVILEPIISPRTKLK